MRHTNLFSKLVNMHIIIKKDQLSYLETAANQLEASPRPSQHCHTEWLILYNISVEVCVYFELVGLYRHQCSHKGWHVPTQRCRHTWRLWNWLKYRCTRWSHKEWMTLNVKSPKAESLRPNGGWDCFIKAFVLLYDRNNQIQDWPLNCTIISG